jgi:murein DD-endopeptidase
MTRFLLLAALLFAQNTNTGLEGKWEGALTAGPAKLRLVVDISKASDGVYLGTLTSVDQGGSRIPLDVIQMNGDSVKFEARAVKGVFEGTMNADKTQVKGTWSQGGPNIPLELTRAAASAAGAPVKPPDSAAAPAPPPSPFGLPFDIQVPVAPTPLSAGGKTHLVYELHVTNFGLAEMPISKLEVLDGNRTIGSYEGGELNAMLQRPGLPGPPTDVRSIAPGMRAIAYLWVTLDASSPIPTSLRHRITGRNQTLEAGAVKIATNAALIGPPLRGSDWIALNGPGNASIHRRAMIPLNGRPSIAQRFAIDWVKVGANGRMFDGDEKDNKAYASYGSEILAVADGIVASIKDGIPENVPGITSRAVPITPETIAGNHVILDIGQGRYALFAHMQPGSLRVKPGDRVRRGQVLGLVGNSGNATGPHLHFHLADSPMGLDAEGLPYAIDSWEVMTAPNTWQKRQNEMPVQNDRVRFP